MRPVLLVLLLLVPSTAVVAGCVECNPTEVPATVSVERADELVRTLPMLSSGATEVAGQQVPDAHGYLDVNLSITHGISSFQVTDLRLHVAVGGSEVPIDLLEIDGGTGFDHDGDQQVWHGRATNNTQLRLWWAVDRDQLSALGDIVLEEGASYKATVSFAWRHEGCDLRASGEVEQAFDDHVQASVDAVTFGTTRGPELQVGDTGVGFKADYEVESGLEVDVTGAQARALFIGSQVTNPLGLVLFPHVGWQVDGQDTDHVAPGQTLRVQSTQAGSGEYGQTGRVVPLALGPGDGIYVLSVDITYEPADPTMGVHTDTFAYAIER